MASLNTERKEINEIIKKILGNISTINKIILPNSANIPKINKII